MIRKGKRPKAEGRIPNRILGVGGSGVSTFRRFDVLTFHRPAFSLAEMLVAIGILAIGMGMVAMFFPVAMYQHADNTIQHNAMRIALEAKNFVLSSHTKPVRAFLALPIPQYWQPTMTYRPGVMWPQMITPPANPGNVPYFTSEVRYVWQLFQRSLGGTDQYFVAVTRTMPGQSYDQQTTGALPLGNFTGPGTVPQPWIRNFGRINARTLDPSGGTFPWPLNHMSAASALPTGTAIIGNATGAVYTVLNVTAQGYVVLRENLLPADDAFLVGSATFFIWYPPPVNGDKSPLVMTLSF